MGRLAIHDLTLGYDGHPAVHHLTGVFDDGSLTAVCGPNGAGKSTLIKALAGALKPLGGAIDRGGLGPRAIGYLPQAAEIDRSFPIDVFDFVALGCIRRAGLFGRVGAADRKATQEAKEKDERMLAVNGARSVDSFHRELGLLCWDKCGMARNEKGLREALKRIPELRQEFWRNVRVTGACAGLNRAL